MKKFLPIFLLTGLFLLPQAAFAGLSEGCFPIVKCDPGQDFYAGACATHIETLANCPNPGAPTKYPAFSCDAGCYEKTKSTGSVNPCPGGIMVNNVCLIKLNVVDDNVPVTGTTGYKIWDGSDLTHVVHVDTAGCAVDQIPVSDAASSTGWSCKDPVWLENGLDVYHNGDVGINTNNPAYDLDVNGTTNSSEYCIGASECITDWAAASLWSEAGADIYFDTGNVGVGTNAPGYALDVNGDTRLGSSTDGLLISSTGVITNGNMNPVQIDDFQGLDVTREIENSRTMATDQATCENTYGGYYTLSTCYLPVKIGDGLDVAGVAGIKNSYSNYGVLINDPDGLDVREGIGNYKGGSFPLMITDDSGLRIADYNGNVGLSVAANGDISDLNGHVYVNDYLDVSGRLAVGHTNPGAGIHVKSSGWPGSFLFLDTNSVSQDAGIRLYEAGSVRGHIYNKANDGDKMIIEREGGNGDIELWAYETHLKNNVRVHGSMTVNEDQGGNSWLEMYAAGGKANYLDFSEISGGQEMGFQLNHYGASDRFYIRSYNNTAEINNATVRMSVERTTGDVGIGITNPGYRLHVYENCGAFCIIGRFQGTSTVDIYGDGWIWANGGGAKPGGGSWSSISDVRVKDVEGAYVKGLEELTALNPIRYRYKTDNPRGFDPDIEYVGLVAQEVQPLFPEAVTEGTDGYLQLDTSSIDYAVINSIKELKAENDSLKAVVCELKPEAEICNQ